MTSDEIGARRRALYEQGGLRLEFFMDDAGRQRGRMVASQPGDWAAMDRAQEYNRLADAHRRIGG